MKNTNANLGDMVAVNKCVDGQIYQIVSKQGFMVELCYKQNGHTLHGGWLDVGSCHKPTKAQLEHYSKTM